MQTPRMTTRRWMIAVAIVAVLMWGVVRTRFLQLRAAYHAQEKQQCIGTAQRYEKLYQLREKLIPTASVVMTLWLETQEDYEGVGALGGGGPWPAGIGLRRAYGALDFGSFGGAFTPDDRNACVWGRWAGCRLLGGGAGWLVGGEIEGGGSGAGGDVSCAYWAGSGGWGCWRRGARGDLGGCERVAWAAAAGGGGVAGGRRARSGAWRRGRGPRWSISVRARRSRHAEANRVIAGRSPHSSSTPSGAAGDDLHLPCPGTHESVPVWWRPRDGGGGGATGVGGGGGGGEGQHHSP